MDQFRNFKRFIDKVDKYGMKSGIIKVIPPSEWYVNAIVTNYPLETNGTTGANPSLTLPKLSRASKSRIQSRKSSTGSMAYTHKRTLRSSDHTTYQSGGQ